MRRSTILASLFPLAIAIWSTACRGKQFDEELAPSAKIGADVQKLLQPGMTTDDLHRQLQTIPAMVRRGRFHWQLADGSLWTDFMPTKRGMRIVAWQIESDSLKAEGGESHELGQLMTYYYQTPAPDEIHRVIELAGSLGLFDEEHTRRSMTAFLSHAYRQNPDRIADWAKAAQSLPDKIKQVVYAAIWEASVDESSGVLEEVAVTDRANQQFLRDLISHKPVDLLEREITAPMNLDDHWAAFFATGDRRYVERICSVLSWDVSGLDRKSDRWLINGAAAWSLGANARRHPLVAEVCRELAPSADEHAKPLYAKILADLEPSK